MIDELVKLLTLQGYDKEIYETTDYIKESEGQIKHWDKRIEQAREKLAAKEKELRQKQHQGDEAEAQIKMLETSYKERNYQLMSLKDQKSYDSMKSQLQDIRDRISDLEDLAVECMTEVEENQTVIDGFKEKLNAEVERVEKEREDAKTKSAEMLDQIKDLKVKAENYAQTIKPELLNLYKRLIHIPGRNPIVPLQERACTGCFSNITMEQVELIKAGKIVQCEVCNRIVYLPEVLKKEHPEG